MLTQFINEIVCGDIFEVMAQIPDGSVDLVVTSPPYNLKNSTGNGMKDGRGSLWKAADNGLRQGYDSHGDTMSHVDYVQWQRACLREMMRVIPDNGAIFYNHKWRVQDGLLQDRHDIVDGFPVRQIIIWARGSGLNFNQGYFVPTYEVIYMIAKKKFKLAPKGNAKGDVWRFNAERGNSHPAPFPVELPERIIASTVAALVLDPFVGSGSTAIAARRLGRNFIGIDNSPEYCEMAVKRLKEIENE